VDTPAFQRLRYVRQLGHAFLVYPGATHTRFEHAVGTYHLARRALDLLGRRGALEGLTDADAQFLRIGALLHDIGHYPFSHALEESGFPSHETVGARILAEPPLADLLAAEGIPDAAARIGALIDGTSTHPLARLISGSVDLDKLDYLRRDALMCGVPYGEVDVERLLSCLTLVTLEGRRTVGIAEKGLAPLESLLFAKYQMYRNVYWHHTVRSATAMFKRAVREAVVDRAIDPAGLATATDDALLHELLSSDRTGLAAALRERRLYKRALEVVPAAMPVAPPDWLGADPGRLARAENELARRVGLGPAELLIDLPHKTAMLGVDLPILRVGGSVDRLTQAPWPGHVDVPPFAEGLAESACRLRVFVKRKADVTEKLLLDVLAA
jgi:HD superfamily phosphohydrolase